MSCSDFNCDVFCADKLLLHLHLKLITDLSDLTINNHDNVTFVITLVFFFPPISFSASVFPRHCQVSEMAVSELPGNPNAVWTVRRHVEGITFPVSDIFFENVASTIYMKYFT